MNMDIFVCDHMCWTVGEAINKYNIPDDWSAEFDAYDGVYSTIVIRVDQIRKNSAMMNVELRMIENPDDEYAGCIILRDQQTVAFKIDYLRELISALKTQSCPCNQTDHIG